MFLLFERLDALNGVPNDEDTVALPLSKKTNSKVDEVTVKTLMVKYCSVKRNVAWDAGVAATFTNKSYCLK